MAPGTSSPRSSRSARTSSPAARTARAARESGAAACGAARAAARRAPGQRRDALQRDPAAEHADEARVEDQAAARGVHVGHQAERPLGVARGSIVATTLPLRRRESRSRERRADQRALGGERQRPTVSASADRRRRKRARQQLGQNARLPRSGRTAARSSSSPRTARRSASTPRRRSRSRSRSAARRSSRRSRAARADLVGEQLDHCHRPRLGIARARAARRRPPLPAHPRSSSEPDPARGLIGADPSSPKWDASAHERPRNARNHAELVLALSVGVVLADSSIVTLALPDVLAGVRRRRSFGVSWVLTAFNLALALAILPDGACSRATRPRAAGRGPRPLQRRLARLRALAAPRAP